VAKYLLDEGAQLEAKDEWQGRALHMAALYGHDKVVDLLVERGADVRGPFLS
jgi:ankyrin repeat protein